MNKEKKNIIDRYLNGEITEEDMFKGLGAEKVPVSGAEDTEKVKEEILNLFDKADREAQQYVVKYVKSLLKGNEYLKKMKSDIFQRISEILETPCMTECHIKIDLGNDIPANVTYECKTFLDTEK